MEKISHFLPKYQFYNPNWQVNCLFWEDPYSCLHDHPYYEFQLIVKGSCYYVSNGTKTLLQKGDLIFINNDVVHQILPNNSDPYSTLVVGIMPDCLQSIASSISLSLLDTIRKYNKPVYHLVETDFNYLCKLVDKCQDCMSGVASTNYHIKAWTTSALMAIYENLNSSFPEYPSWLGDLLFALHNTQNMEKRFSEITEAIKFAPATLSKYFKKYFNQTPNEYFVSQKLQYASILLKQTDYTTLRIAQAIGIDSLSHFNKIFKKAYGETPKQFRNNAASTKKET